MRSDFSRAFAAACGLLVVGGLASAANYSTNADISASRGFSTQSVGPGDTVTVTLTVDIGAIGSDPIRGLYISDHVPAGLSPTSVSVKRNGSNVAGVILESKGAGAIYSGCTTERWALEEPGTWAGQALSQGDTLVVTYTLTVPSSQPAGDIVFPGFSWVGMIKNLGDPGDHFGYEEADAAKISVTDSLAPTISSVAATSETAAVVIFTEAVEQTSAEASSNYAIDNSVSVSGASLGGDGKTVTLTTSTLTEGVTYTLTVTGVEDLAGNPAADSAQFTYVSELVITGTSPAGYVWDVLDVDKNVYVDRTFTYSSVPGSYVGLDYLQTANADKNSAGDSFLAFDVNQDVTVCVAHDNRISSKPSWLGSFSDTGDDLVTTDTTLSLFAKDFAAGTVTLGGNGGSGQSMYTVVVRPSDGGPVVDTPPPSVPANLSATAASTSEINLSWDASSDAESGIDHYSIHRDGTQIDTITGTSYSDTGLSAGTQYTYEVSAVNGAGLESAKSLPASGTTFAATDSDSDGLPDEWEVMYFSDVADCVPGEDTDGDDLVNADEYAAGTDPTEPDTDGDGMTDGWEVANLLDPTADDSGTDPDGDGSTNVEEFLAGTDPRSFDSPQDAGGGSTGLGCAAGPSAASALAPLLALLIAFFGTMRRTPDADRFP